MEDKKDSTQDVEIAVLAKELEHMVKNISSLEKTTAERIQSLTETIRSFIEVASKKVDRDVYLEDKRNMALQISELRADVKKNADFRKEMNVSIQTKNATEKNIWGVSQGTLQTIMSLLTLVTLVAAVVAIFQ